MRHYRDDYKGAMKKVEEQVQIMDDANFSNKYTQPPSDVEDSFGNEGFLEHEQVQDRLIKEVEKWSRAQNKNLHRSASKLLEEMDQYFWQEKNDQSTKVYHLFRELEKAEFSQDDMNFQNSDLGGYNPDKFNKKYNR